MPWSYTTGVLRAPKKVDLARIELATPSCEDGGIPLTYRPGKIYSRLIGGSPTRRLPNELRARI